MSVVTVTIGGKTVTVTEETTPRGIWRGNNADGSRRKVAELPAKGWTFTVQGTMSGSALTHAGALARAEYFVRAGDKRGLRSRFALNRADADALIDAEYAEHAALLEAYPFEMDPDCKLSTATFLKSIADGRDQQRAILMGLV